MPKTIPAAAPGLPSANIVPFPIAPDTADFEVTKKQWDQAYIAIQCSLQFVDDDDAGIDAMLADMLAYSPEGPARIILENGKALDLLRRATAFLAAIDLRLQAAAIRLVEARGL